MIASLGVDPLSRARRATTLVRSERTWGRLAIDHVGWFEAPEDVTCIVRALGLPSVSFPSVVLAEALNRDVRITRIAVAPRRHLELFSVVGAPPPSTVHLAFHAQDRTTLERTARRFGASVHTAFDGAKLAYLLPGVEIICNP